MNAGKRRHLLIVPYGIETSIEYTSFHNFVTLLIVPYGIETQVQVSGVQIHLTFNRTLWN